MVPAKVGLYRTYMYLQQVARPRLEEVTKWDGAATVTQWDTQLFSDTNLTVKERKGVEVGVLDPWFGS